MNHFNLLLAIFLAFLFVNNINADNFSVGTSEIISNRESLEAVQDLNSGYFDDSWRNDLPVVTIQPDGTASDDNTGSSSSATCQNIIDDLDKYPNGVRIILAAGTHEWSNRVSLRSNVSIEGAGSNETLIHCQFPKGTNSAYWFRGQPFMIGAHHPAFHTIDREMGYAYYGTPVKGLTVGSITCIAVNNPVIQGSHSRNSDFFSNPPDSGQLVMIADKSFARDGGGEVPPATHNFPQWVKVLSVEGNTIEFDEPRVIDWAEDGSGVMFWPSGNIDGSSKEPFGIIENIRLEGFKLLELQHFHRRGGCRNMLVKDVNASDIDPDLLNKTYNGISANAIYRSTFVDCKFRGGIHSFEKKGASARSVLKNLTLHVEPMSSKRPYASTGEGAYSIHYINCTFEMPNANDNEKVNMIVRHEQFGGSFKNIIINGNGYSCKANFFDLILSGRYHPSGYTPFDVIFNGELTLNRLFRLSSGDPPLALDYTINGNVNTTVEEKNWDDTPPSANAGEDIHKSDSNNINIYPNPTTGKLNIQFPFIDNYIVSIYTISGKLIYKESFKNKMQCMLSLDHLKNNIYVLVIPISRNNKIFKTAKILLNKQLSH